MIQMTGIDHTTGSVNERSVFAFKNSEMEPSMQFLRERTGADGVVILSTCNRTEIWVSADPGAGVFEALCALKGVDPAEHRAFFTDRERGEAVRHLFSMTSGLESAIVAEDQILTQVGDALACAREHYMTDKVLEVLFRNAVAAAKRVKTEVVFSHADQTAMEAALKMFAEQGYDPAGKTCMVIGNGQFGKLTAEALVRAGANVTVTVREYHSGVVLIPDGCSRILYGEKMDFFPKCDIVVSATTSPNYTLYYDQVVKALPDHPMILIDFAVPRDIEPEIRELDCFTVYDIDDFRTGVDVNDAAWKQAQAILDEATEGYRSWYANREVISHVAHINSMAADDMSFRIRKSIRRLDVGENEKQKLAGDIASSSGKIAQKMLFMLRDELEPEAFARCVEIIENAYGREEAAYGKV
ncbi:MAG: glutamyl-tRNA reductase [Lachnospiraceae bacterium]|nr:glutamyl-tRNA reductase [Lachnospiraceae bacterium]